MYSSTVRPRTCTTAILAPTWRHSFHVEWNRAAYRHLGVTRFEHHRDPGRVRRGGCERGLILCFGLWRGLMLDRLPVLRQPAPHPGHQLHRVRRPLLRSHLVQPVLEGPAEVDLLSFLPPLGLSAR